MVQWNPLEVVGIPKPGHNGASESKGGGTGRRGGRGIWSAARGLVDAGNCSSVPQGLPEQGPGRA